MKDAGNVAAAVIGRLEPDPDRDAAHDRWLEEKRTEATAKRRDTGRAFLRDARAPNALQADPALVPDELRAWIGGWKSAPFGCALLCGPVGVGKSMAAQWAIAELFRRGRWDDDEAPRDWLPLTNAMRVRCVEVQRAVYADRIHVLAETLENVGLLVIDDVRRYPESAWRIADEMHAILDARCEWNRATILTTNLVPDEFAAAYESLWSRIHASAPGAITVVRDDLRLAR